MQKFTTFLMFEGRAEEAMNFYISLFDNSSMVHIKRYGPEGPGAEGSVFHAIFELNGQKFMAIDSAGKHEFTFTPSISIYVNCADDAEIERVFAAIAADGKVMMPLGNYGFSQKFGWISDQFGVSWQLNLA